VQQDDLRCPWWAAASGGVAATSGVRNSPSEQPVHSKALWLCQVAAAPASQLQVLLLGQAALR
jgi:hypothetical protein